MKCWSIEKTVPAFVTTLLAVFLLVPAARASDNGGPHIPILDCGDPKNDDCYECCLPNCGDGKLFCCQKDCDVINMPPSNPEPEPVDLRLTIGGAQIAYSRKFRTQVRTKQPFFEVTLRQIFHSTVSKQTLSITVKLTGADAALGSLLYPVAFLAAGNGALDVLHAQGLDVSIMGAAPSKTCQAKFQASTCTLLANQLAQGIAGTLAEGNVDRNTFLFRVQNMGFTPCVPILG